MKRTEVSYAHLVMRHLFASIVVLVWNTSTHGAWLRGSPACVMPLLKVFNERSSFSPATLLCDRPTCCAAGSRLFSIMQTCDQHGAGVRRRTLPFHVEIRYQNDADRAI
jgi:hypothetical protein